MKTLKPCHHVALLIVCTCVGAINAAWNPPYHNESCRGDRAIQTLTDCKDGEDNLVQVSQPNPTDDAVLLLSNYVYTYDGEGHPTCMAVDGKRKGILTCPGSIRWHYDFKTQKALKPTWYASVKYTIHKCSQNITGLPSPWRAACCDVSCASQANAAANGYTLPENFCTKDCEAQEGGDFPLCDKFERVGERYATGNTTDIDYKLDPAMASFFVGLFDLDMMLCTKGDSPAEKGVCPTVTLTANGVPVDAKLCVKK